MNMNREEIMEGIKQLKARAPISLVDFTEIFGEIQSVRRAMYIGNGNGIFYKSASIFGVNYERITELRNRLGTDDFIIVLYQRKKNQLTILPYWIINDQIINANVGWGTNNNIYVVHFNNNNLNWGGVNVEDIEYRVNCDEKFDDQEPIRVEDTDIIDTDDSTGNINLIEQVHNYLGSSFDKLITDKMEKIEKEIGEIKEKINELSRLNETVKKIDQDNQKILAFLSNKK